MGRQSEMDFKRIELIFLLTFLSLNIFLLYSYFGKATTLTYESAETSTVVPFDEMKTDGIKFDAKQFSDEKLLVPYVKAKNDNLLKQKVDQLPKDTTISMEDKYTIYRPLTEPLELFPVGEKFNSKDIKKYAEKIDAFIAKEYIFFGESYNFFKYSATQNAIIYTQKAEGFRILDGTGRITFHMDGGKIISYIQTYAGKIEVTGKSRPLISEKNAIESLYQNNEIPADSVINGRPKLGYYRTLWLPKDNLSIYGPVWYVSLKIGNEEKIKLVSGVDGTIIKHTSSTTNDSDSSSDGAATEEELAPLE